MIFLIQVHVEKHIEIQWVQYKWVSNISFHLTLSLMQKVLLLPHVIKALL